MGKKKAEADKIKVTNLQPLRKELQDNVFAHEAATVAVLEMLIKVALELEAYIAEMLEPGRPWLLETRLYGKIWSCAEFLDGKSVQRLVKLNIINFRCGQG